MKRKLFLAAAVAALSVGAAQAAPGNSGLVSIAPSGVAAEEAKVTFHFGFGHPYYYQPHDRSPYYYAPHPQYHGPYQSCHLGVCY